MMKLTVDRQFNTIILFPRVGVLINRHSCRRLGNNNTLDKCGDNNNGWRDDQQRNSRFANHQHELAKGTDGCGSNPLEQLQQQTIIRNENLCCSSITVMSSHIIIIISNSQ